MEGGLINGARQFSPDSQHVLSVDEVTLGPFDGPSPCESASILCVRDGEFKWMQELRDLGSDSGSPHYLGRQPVNYSAWHWPKANVVFLVGDWRIVAMELEDGGVLAELEIEYQGAGPARAVSGRVRAWAGCPAGGAARLRAARARRP